MSVTECFDFLARPEPFIIDRRVVHYRYFMSLRRHLRPIFQALGEAGGDRDVDALLALKYQLARLLTAPVPFDAVLLEALNLLGERTDIKQRWGVELERAFDSASKSAKNMASAENPMRVFVRDEIESLIETGSRFRIHAHKDAEKHFRSLCGALSGEEFFFKADEYASLPPFDVLLKVGPFRSRGFGRCPDAFLTAPRFGRLVQFVWSGSADEPGFGLDPVTQVSTLDKLREKQDPGACSQPSPLEWSLQTSDIGNVEGDALIMDEAEEDDFRFLAGSNRGREHAHQLRSAALVEFSTGFGMLLPAREKIAVYDPDGQEPSGSVERMDLKDSRVDGSFLALPDLDSADLGELQVGKTHYSSIWKKCLADVIDGHCDDLCSALRRKDVGLLMLKSRVLDWCKPPATVIPAPQRMEHFFSLLSVLAREFGRSELSGDVFAKKAWMEIRRSRGAAINEGREEHRQQREVVFDMLKGRLTEIDALSADSDDFLLPLPEGGVLCGEVRFVRIESVEAGLCVPDSIMREMQEMKEFDIWRG